MSIEIKHILFVILVVILLLKLMTRSYRLSEHQSSSIDNSLRKKNLQTMVLLVGSIIVVYIVINIVISMFKVETKQQIIQFILWVIITQFVSSIMTICYMLPHRQKIVSYIPPITIIGRLYGTSVGTIIAITSCYTLLVEIAANTVLSMNAISSFFIPMELSLLSKSIAIGSFLYICTQINYLINIFQFLLIGIILPALALLLWIIFGEWQVLIALVKAIYMFDFKSAIDITSILALINHFLLSSSNGYYMNPALLQIILLTKNTQQVNIAIIAASIISIKCILLFIFILLHAELFNQNLLVNSFYITLIVGLVIVGALTLIILAINYSTSALITIFINNLYKPLGINKRYRIGNNKLPTICKIFIALLISLLSTINCNWLNLVFITQAFYISIVGVSLITSILGVHSKDAVVLLGMFSSGITIMVWYYFLDEYTPMLVVLSILMNLTIVRLSNYILQHDRKLDLSKYKKVLYFIAPRIRNIKIKTGTVYQLLRTITIEKIINYFFSNTYFISRYYTHYAVFIMISIVIMWIAVDDFILFCNIEIASLLIMFSWFQAKVIIFHKLWPISCKKYIAMVWYFSVFYTLIFLSTVLASSMNFMENSSTFFLLNVVVASILVRPQIFWVMIIIGIPLGVWVSTIFSLKLINDPISR